MTTPPYELKPGVTPEAVQNAVKEHFAENTAAVVGFNGLMWRISQNPCFVWSALAYLTANAPLMPLPDWVSEYLREASGNVVRAISNLPPDEVLALVPQALGLSRQGANAVSDAHKLLDAFELYGHYVAFKQAAPGKNRAEWAEEQIAAKWQLSLNVVKRRRREAKGTIRRALAASKSPHDDNAVSELALKFGNLIGSISEKLDAVAPALLDTRASLRAAFDGTPLRGERDNEKI